ncbi:hypothetical protein EV645_6832 [Kribbella rubisoli]|uniref:Uncharacterized protein n=1 Tax=Kribbella rubisoli TaxID=3075929 RepID=A0A4Q7WK80_9ACTN|nr:hypothetical protein [Kribbella rubisoli]RZU10370.1 hypothetical protein EV645_6832 [Kribbella rubisoli]
MSPTEQAPRAHAAWRWSNGVVITLGALGLLPLVFPGLALWYSLPHVDPRDADQGADPVDIHSARYLLFALLLILLANGLPRAARWSARGSVGGAVLQGVCGVAVGFWTYAGTAFGAGAYFTGSDDACTYPNCWPVHTEEKLSFLAGTLTGVAMIVMALLVNRIPWVIRTTVPLVVCVAGVLIHHWLWVTYLVPIFEAPPG